MRGVSTLVTHYSTLRYDGKSAFTNKIFYADSTYFKVFGHTFLKGNPRTAFREPNSIVLTESFAKKLFGNEDPLDKPVQYDYSYRMINGKVTGIIKDFPSTTHLPFDALITFNSNNLPLRYDNTINGSHLHSYLLLNDAGSGKTLLNKFPEFYNKYLRSRLDSLNITCDLNLQPLQSIYLESDLIYEPFENGSKKSVTIFTLAGILLILLAVINYINIMTAISTSRAREISMRKIFGAKKHSLIFQLLTESVILTLFATLISVLIVQIQLPWFSRLTGTELRLFSENWPVVIVILILGALLLGLFSGLYPSYMVSGFPSLAFERESPLNKKSGSIPLRKLLVIFQIFISVSIIISAAIVARQYKFSINKDPGFKKENVIIFQVKDTIIINHLPAIKTDLKSLAGIIDVTAASRIPGDKPNSALMSGIQGDGTPVTMTPTYMNVDFNFIDLMNMKVIQGEKFDRTKISGEDNVVIVNETALNKFGWKDLGDDKKVGWGVAGNGVPFLKVIGVVKDLQWMSVHNVIKPMLLFPTERPLELRLYMYVAVEPSSGQRVIRELDSYFRKYSLNNPLEYYFLDDWIANQYRAEKKMMIILMLMTIINISIASLGFIGLISFISNRRRKEFSLRKVFGATASQNFSMVSKEFITLVTFANLLSWPVIFYFMRDWLNNFAAHTDIKMLTFVIVYIISLAITFATITYHLLRAVRENPVNALRQP